MIQNDAFLQRKPRLTDSKLVTCGESSKTMTQAVNDYEPNSLSCGKRNRNRPYKNGQN